MAAVAIQGIAFAGLGALCASSAEIAASAASAADRIQEFVHVEHLVDAAAARAGTGPGAGALPLSISNRNVVELPADLDYDGRVDAQSKERTAIALATRAGGESGLAFRLGRQSIAVGSANSRGAEISQGFVTYSGSASVLVHWFSLPLGEEDLLAIARRPGGR
jgi:hypothetical protein